MTNSEEAIDNLKKAQIHCLKSISRDDICKWMVKNWDFAITRQDNIIEFARDHGLLEEKKKVKKWKYYRIMGIMGKVTTNDYFTDELAEKLNLEQNDYWTKDISTEIETEE